jgi:hypothetical protein
MDPIELDFIPSNGGTAARMVLPGRDALVLIAKGLARPVPPKTQAARSAAAVPPVRRSLPTPQRLELPEGLRAFATRIERNT